MKTAFAAVLAVTKKVTVLIFAIFAHGASKGLPIRSQGRRFEGRRAKTGAQVVLRPRFLGIAVVCRRLLRRLVELLSLIHISEPTRPY